ncbi:uncharacterized protein LOC6569889 [Drosophila grimshawi]|uniref:uncharacterized protein LOC6569889 n=1 Tax=Drosophila grimshawi TaxID=7222 RepID=UPI000C86F515|nr:uncharacterized protein LOC6569889 [Drosophila grimshawi]
MMRISGLFLLLASFNFCLVSQGYAQCIDTYEPGCKQLGEIGLPQRHCIDPTKYWLCHALNEKAERKKCQLNTGFDQDVGACIPWIAWIWKQCREPPSRPIGWQQCE